MQFPIAVPRPDHEALQRELYSFCLYRLLEAALFALLVFSPAGLLIGAPDHPVLAAVVCVTYLALALLLLAYRREPHPLRGQVLLGVGIDIVAATLATHAMPAAASGIALLLLFNVGAAALLLRLRLGLAVAAAAAALLVAEYIFGVVEGHASHRPVAELMMFAMSFLAIATLTHQLGKRMHASQDLADQRGAEIASLAAINELIIRRMRTGVMLVDAEGKVRLANEAAVLLLGEVGGGNADLATVAPELMQRVEAWRLDDRAEQGTLLVGNERLEVLPRFARLLPRSRSVLVFLDDTSLLSRRAESLTLTAMGRFSASLAHEIRNPLAAISYATQLMEESRDITDADRRLLQIIHQQCLRTNGIVESVLGLARRERANVEHIELTAFVLRFVDDFRETMPADTDHLNAATGPSPVGGMFDSRHLHQVLTVLVQNALRHGRIPGEAARVTVAVHQSGDGPAIDVIDRGPGIAEGNQAQLFRPFFTTSEHGTGLGLYIARELCRANGGNVDYVSLPAGGACFRVTMPAPNTLLPA